MGTQGAGLVNKLNLEAYHYLFARSSTAQHAFHLDLQYKPTPPVIQTKIRTVKHAVYLTYS